MLYETHIDTISPIQYEYEYFKHSITTITVYLRLPHPDYHTPCSDVAIYSWEQAQLICLNFEENKVIQVQSQASLPPNQEPTYFEHMPGQIDGGPTSQHIHCTVCPLPHQLTEIATEHITSRPQPQDSVFSHAIPSLS